MGLDIVLGKPVKIDNFTEEDDDYILLSDVPELELFKSFAIDKTNSYFDLESTAKKRDIDLNDLEWRSTQYGENTVFKYFNTKHELFETYKLLNEIWHKVYFKTRNQLFNSFEFKQYREHIPILKKYGYKQLYKFYARGNKKHYFNLNWAWKLAEKKCTVTIIDPEVTSKVEKCIKYEKIGYQRKGANKKFYEDEMWDSPCIVDSKTLNEVWEKYFSYNTPDSKGGYGSGVEYDLSDDEMRKYFKENIIDKFIEGETFVMFC